MKLGPFCPQGHYMPSTGCFISPSGPTLGMVGFVLFALAGGDALSGGSASTLSETTWYYQGTLQGMMCLIMQTCSSRRISDAILIITADSVQISSQQCTEGQSQGSMSERACYQEEPPATAVDTNAIRGL
jgi:hypothetical protein